MVYVLYHDRRLLDGMALAAHLSPLDLNSLAIGKFQTNRMSESRAFFAELDYVGSEFVGLASARWAEKYPDQLNLIALSNLEFDETVVWAPAVAHAGWVSLSVNDHPGMQTLFDELASLTNTSIQVADSNRTVWSNNFVCHQKVFRELQDFFKSTMNYFVEKYGFDFPFDVPISGNYGNANDRLAGFWGERLTMWFFATYKNITIQWVPLSRSR